MPDVPLTRPAGLHDRLAEWADLAEFATDQRQGSTLAFVYGRRRQGKTYLLQALAEATGGLVFSGLQLSEAQNLQRLAQAYAEFRGSPPGTTQFRDWDTADQRGAHRRAGSPAASPCGH